MASPTFAELGTQTTNAVRLLDDLLTAPAFVTNLDTLTQDMEGDYAEEILAAAKSIRAAYAGALGASRASALLWPIMKAFGKVIGSPSTSAARIFRDLFDYMAANAQRVESRNITFGSVAAGGSNAGNGTVYRLTTDKDSYAIEAVHLDVVTLEVVRDQNTGTEKGREEFELRMGDPGPDILEIFGKPKVGKAFGIVGDRILSNASFGSSSGTGGSLVITDWTVTAGSIANVTMDTTNFFRKAPEESAGKSYQIAAAQNVSIQQKISTTGKSFDRTKPCLYGVRWNTLGSGRTGSLTIRMGAANVAYAFSGAEGSGWNTLVLLRNQNLWSDNFDEDDIDFTIEATGAGAGTLNIDDAFCAEGVEYDNLWYWPVGGATAWLNKDKYTFTDALAGSDAKVQKWLWRAHGIYLPHTTTATDITISDP